jgi:hypothetical protein
MTLKDLKDWANSLPSEFSEFEVVNAEAGNIKGTEFSYRLDKPVTILTVDEQNKEILILNDAEKDIDEEDLNGKNVDYDKNN